MAIFNNFLYVYQRVNTNLWDLINGIHFNMIWLLIFLNPNLGSNLLRVYEFWLAIHELFSRDWGFLFLVDPAWRFNSLNSCGRSDFRNEPTRMANRNFKAWHCISKNWGLINKLNRHLINQCLAWYVYGVPMDPHEVIHCMCVSFKMHHFELQLTQTQFLCFAQTHVVCAVHHQTWPNTVVSPPQVMFPKHFPPQRLGTKPLALSGKTSWNGGAFQFCVLVFKLH